VAIDHRKVAVRQAHAGGRDLTVELIEEWVSGVTSTSYGTGHTQAGWPRSLGLATLRACLGWLVVDVVVMLTHANDTPKSPGAAANHKP
jgi:hypothetical protein